jgi:hypothetical protein
VAGVALHTVKTATVHRHHRALHVDKIVLAQTPAILSEFQYQRDQSLCHTAAEGHKRRAGSDPFGRPGHRARLSVTNTTSGLA